MNFIKYFKDHFFLYYSALITGFLIKAMLEDDISFLFGIIPIFIIFIIFIMVLTFLGYLFEGKIK